MTTRPYRKRKRADSEAGTRSRIVDAAMELHEELGPKDTSVSAIAERAGVQRLTVYRHFPDLDALFRACTSTWLEAHPPPDLAATRPDDVLAALYAYYAATRGMWTSAYRDLDDVPALHAPMAEVDAYLDAAADVLVKARGGGRDPALKAACRAAVRFATWRTLAELGLSTRKATALATAWIDGAAGAFRSSR